jgi:hypothetical protein
MTRADYDVFLRDFFRSLTIFVVGAAVCWVTGPSFVGDLGICFGTGYALGFLSRWAPRIAP